MHFQNKKEEEMRNLIDLIAAAPSATNVDLILERPCHTIVLRDLL